MHAGDVLGTVGDQQVTAPVDGVIETVAQDNDMVADYPLFSIRYGGMSASVDATALLATIDPDQPLTGRFQITDAQGPTDCAAVVRMTASPLRPHQRKIRPDRRRLRMGRNRLAHCNACSQRTCRRVPGRTPPWY